jgi:hypothetical protein
MNVWMCIQNKGETLKKLIQKKINTLKNGYSNSNLFYIGVFYLIL